MPSDQSSYNAETAAPSVPCCNSASFPTFGLAEDVAADTADGTSLVGLSLAGRYQLLELIGTGGFGWVFRARQTLPARDVAIKVPRHRTRMSHRFRREANLLGALEHDAIAKVFDAGEFTLAGVETTYVVMQLIRGAQPIDRYCVERQLPLHRRVKLFLAVCDAVAHAHRKGIVHRDLKPGNILIDDMGRPWVIDFGIATFATDDVEPIRTTRSPVAQATATETRGIVGTPKYMSPEQRVPGHAIDARADVYALGKVLHDVMTAGAPPHPARLPGELERVSRRCTEERPADRYSDAGALAAALRESLAEDAGPTSLATALPTTTVPLSPEPRDDSPRSFTRSRLAAIVLVGIAVLIVWVIPQPVPLPAPPTSPVYVQALSDLATAAGAGDTADAAAAYRNAEAIWRRSSPRNANLPLELTVLRGLAVHDSANSVLHHVVRASVDPAGHWLAVGDTDGSVSLSLLSKPDQPVHRLPGLRTNTTASGFSPDGRLLVGADDGGRLCAWELHALERNASPRRFGWNDATKARAGICGIDFSPLGTRIATVDTGGTIAVWEAGSGRRLAETVIAGDDSPGRISLCFDADDRVVIGHPSGKVFVWPKTSPPRDVKHRHGAGPVLLARSGTAALIVSTGADGMLCVRDGKTAAPLGEPITLPVPPQALGLTPDGRRLFVACPRSADDQASAGDILRVFDMDQGKQGRPPLHLVNIHVPHRVASLSLADDACVAVAESANDPSLVWKRPTELTADDLRPAVP
jgi:serine/threonine protein kinase